MTLYSSNTGYEHSPASFEVSRFRKLNLNNLNDYAFGPINPKETRLLSLSEIKARRDLSLSIVDQQESRRYERKEDSRASGVGSVERTRKVLRRPMIRKFETSLNANVVANEDIVYSL